MTEEYRNQVRLLLSVLPIVARQKDLVLKGGTALNFFWHDFPRLSVDIDLTYLPVNDRKESLTSISKSVQKIADAIEKEIPGTRGKPQKSGGTLSRLIIRNANTQIKLEVNTVLRGSIFDPVEKELSSRIQNEFELFAALQTLSFEDLYGGKLCAALDRQHPRDLFDVKLLLENEGITEKIRTAFIGYLISHSRPMNELLNPNTIDLDDIYKKEFRGMTNDLVELEELIEVQKVLPKLILQDLTDLEKEFLITFKKGDPQWNLMPVSHLKNLPGVKWKLLNIRKMDEKKHQEMLKKLEEVLSEG
ncbi:nucleotidyl transferase AbiEii/AbiGii toxin family protein [Rhodohalobacter sulfatireducens]|uniref:Nucleotidyl transferase AbiEii/AbiGii toxin family protein n=1 Tax=Rhodohalobacter sulfatireducens TaxID=2911366 RepID=A0ABS9KF73_9BACT|nr:nucleotidyl transferase AbiEii/AbiGii toxin family protein [Rhodohalobacter sulfatireducens]MCG2589510.1 nucleotidyl transferase AbiEii/AbiGii toxin family protein [Rhodohalobacter sulfatireducens]